MINAIDYIPGTSFLHRLNPVSKLALAVSIIAATFSGQSYLVLVSLIALTLLLAASAGAARRLARLLALLIPLGLITVALQCVFVNGGTPLIAFITTDGLVTGSKAALRLLGVALPLVLMLVTTRMNDLANACVEVLHVPYRYAFTFSSALRFVPIFSQEMNAIIEAQTARGLDFDSANPFRRLRLVLPLCVPLLVSSVSKADAAALAAEQRGFYLRGRASSFKRYPLRARDGVTLLLCVAIVATGIAL